MLNDLVDKHEPGYKPRSLGEKIYQGFSYAIKVAVPLIAVAAASLYTFAYSPLAMAGEEPQAKAQKTATHKETNDKRRKVVLEEIEIKGKIPKPEVIFISLRSKSIFPPFFEKKKLIPKIEKMAYDNGFFKDPF